MTKFFMQGKRSRYRTNDVIWLSISFGFVSGLSRMKSFWTLENDRFPHRRNIGIAQSWTMRREYSVHLLTSFALGDNVR